MECRIQAVHCPDVGSGKAGIAFVRLPGLAGGGEWSGRASICTHRHWTNASSSGSRSESRADHLYAHLGPHGRHVGLLSCYVKHRFLESGETKTPFLRPVSKACLSHILRATLYDYAVALNAMHRILIATSNPGKLRDFSGAA